MKFQERYIWYDHLLGYHNQHAILKFKIEIHYRHEVTAELCFQYSEEYYFLNYLRYGVRIKEQLGRIINCFYNLWSS